MEYGLGMVLSGGGSRGLAHVGVLKALGEEGIEPDCLSATSAGAIVAALYAAGYSPEEMLEFFKVKSPFKLSKFALGKPGFIDTEKVVADFLEYFPDNSFEALPKRLYLAATDIVNARLEIFTSGSVLLAMSFERAVIAPRRGCVTDVLDERGGVLYDADDPQGLEGALRVALDADLEAMGRHNGASLDRFDWERVAAATRTVYEAALR